MKVYINKAAWEEEDESWKAISEIAQRENAELQADIGELEQENRLQAARNERLEEELAKEKAETERLREKLQQIDGQRMYAEAEVEKLEQDNQNLRDALWLKSTTELSRKKLQEKLNEALEALEFYADTKVYNSGSLRIGDPINGDRGERAREAIERIKGVTP